MDAKLLAKGLAHSFVIALLAAILLATVVHSLPTYGNRVGVLLMVSFIAAIWTNVGNVIWWFHPVEYAAGQIVYTVVAGLLMALATAAIIRPRATTPGGLIACGSAHARLTAQLRPAQIPSRMPGPIQSAAARLKAPPCQ
jgi:hypothetical protein